MNSTGTAKTKTPDRSYSSQAGKPARRSYAPRYWPSWLWIFFLRWLAMLPLSWSRLAGSALGFLMMISNKKRREIARINIEMCFPRMEPRARQELQRAHFRVTGQSYVDLGFLAWAARARLERKTEYLGLDHYQAALQSGRPVILLVPHCVGINFGGAMLSRWHPACTMVKAQPNPVINWLLAHAQTRYGARLFERREGLRPVLRALNQGLSFHYSPDEDFGAARSVFVDFFGVPTATLPILGRLARSANALVVPCMSRLTDKGYEVKFWPALTTYPTGNEMMDAARMNAAMEAGLREMPEQYMWTFKIFKTRPGGAPSPYG